MDNQKDIVDPLPLHQQRVPVSSLVSEDSIDGLSSQVINIQPAMRRRSEVSIGPKSQFLSISSSKVVENSLETTMTLTVDTKRPSVSLLIQKFDTAANSIQPPIAAPLPRRKSQSFHKSDTNMASSNQTSSNSQLHPFSPPANNDNSYFDSSDKKLYHYQTTNVKAASSVNIVVNSDNQQKIPSIDHIELKPKPVFRKSMQSNPILSRSNATTKKRSSNPSTISSPPQSRKFSRLEFSNTQSDIYLIFKLISRIKEQITNLQIKFDTTSYSSLTSLLNDYMKFAISTASSSGMKDCVANCDNFISNLKSAIQNKDFPQIMSNLISSSFEIQKVLNVLPVQDVPTFKIEFSSIDVFKSYYKDLIPDLESLTESLLLNIKPEFIVVQNHEENHGNNSGHFINMGFFDTTALVYRKLFVGKDHRNYIGVHDKYGELAFSIKREFQTDVQQWMYRILFRCKNIVRTFHFLIPEKEITQKANGEVNDKIYRAILNLIIPKLDVSKMKKIEISQQPQVIDLPAPSMDKIEKSLLQLDQYKTSFTYKIGLLYITQSQSNEIQWFNNILNVGDSKSFDNFCQIIGDVIELKGHSAFAGGLDTRNGMTGDTSIYTKFKYNTKTFEIESSPKYKEESENDLQNAEDCVDFELMFHVNTMLPYTSGDEQQIQRKRHIGNDLVCVVFIDKDGNCTTPFNDNTAPNLISIPQTSSAKRSMTVDSVLSASTVLSQESLVSSTTMESLSNMARREQKVSNFAIDAPFDPRTIRSQFLHVYVIVQEIFVEQNVIDNGYSPQRVKSNASMTSGSEWIPAYRVYTTSLIDVPAFEPSLPDPPIFPIATEQDRLNFRNFFLTKLVNGENAAFHSTKFRSLHGRTYQGLMDAIGKDYMDSDGKGHRMSLIDDLDLKNALTSIMGRRSSSKHKSGIGLQAPTQSGSFSTPSIETNIGNSSNSKGTNIPIIVTTQEEETRRRTSSDSIKRSSIISSARNLTKSGILKSKSSTVEESGDTYGKDKEMVGFLEFLSTADGDNTESDYKQKRKESLFKLDDGLHSMEKEYSTLAISSSELKEAKSPGISKRLFHRKPRDSHEVTPMKKENSNGEISLADILNSEPVKNI